jgi:hypothetical protein
MLYLALQLGAALLELKLPPGMDQEVKASTATRKLAKQVEQWLPRAGDAPASLRARAAFRAQMSGGGLRGVNYLLRLSFSPTEEDWVEGAEERRSWLWDAITRPYRLLRKYGQGG